MLPILFPLYEDEHVTGWLGRLANENGLNYKSFMRIHCPACSYRSVDALSNLASTGFVDDPLKIYKQNTLYYTLYPVLPAGTQARTFQHVLYGGNARFYLTTKRLRWCPECMAEDFRNQRKPYFRVWHQLDEITTCAKHGCCLYITRLDMRFVLDGFAIRQSRLLPTIDPDFDQAIYDLYQHHVKTDVSSWFRYNQKAGDKRSRADLIHAAISKRPVDSVEEEFRYLTCDSCGKSFMRHYFLDYYQHLCPECEKQMSPFELLKNRVEGREGYKLAEGKIIHEKCGKSLRFVPQDFMWDRRLCPCEKGPTVQEYEYLNDDEFEVVDLKVVKKRTLLNVKHKPKGHFFWIEQWTFNQDPKCKICSATPYEQVFFEKVSKMVGDEYEFLTLPAHYLDRIKIRHKMCGQSFETSAKGFLTGVRCKFCFDQIGAEKLISIIKNCCDLTGQTITPINNCKIRVSSGNNQRLYICSEISQDLSRLDGATIFKRKKLMPPQYSPKSILLQHIRQTAVNGIYRSNADYRSLGIKKQTYYQSLTYMVNKGILERLEMGVYKIRNQKEGDDDADTGNDTSL